MFEPIVLTNWDCSLKEYNDDYGNHIGKTKGILGKVVFRGGNNKVYLGKDLKGISNVNLNLCANSTVMINDNTQFNDGFGVEINGYSGSSVIYIGKNNHFLDTHIRMWNHPNTSSIYVSNNCTFEQNLRLHANSGKKIAVGEDCMFSFNVHVQAGDGHAIFDVNTKKNINSQTKEVMTEKDTIVLGNHVWVGAGASILTGTNVADGDIVGAHSVVKGVFPNNVSLAGNPAKVIKRDIAWTRDNGCEDFNRIPADYAKPTYETKPAISGKNVLVIGGTRFMGVWLVKELLEKGNQVTIATRGKTPDYFGRRINRIHMDLNDRESVWNALKDKHYDVVFDNLAYCSKFVDNVLSAVKCDRYIQLSSIAVYHNMKMDMKEDWFEPLKVEPELCGQEVVYARGKRMAEAWVYHKYPALSAVTVRIPFVTKTDRLFYYCKNIVNGIPMSIADTSRCFTFIREREVGKYLTWIAAQNFTGPVNLASVGAVKIQDILSYIEKRVNKKAIIDVKDGVESPFHVYQDTSFSLSMDKSMQLGYSVSYLDEWFWTLLDEYIDRALKECSNEAEQQERQGQINNATISILGDERCTGCGSCVNSCPKDAIKLVVDKEGFMQPVVDADKCISCGLCKKSCPQLNSKSLQKECVSCYALMAQDDVRMVSSSGGAFSVLAENILSKGGVVCGAAWKDDYKVEHIFIESLERLPLLRGSKYVQSDVAMTYRETKQYLENERYVLYSGTPCEIAGLLSYLGKEYEKLITVDLLCRATASNELFHKYMKENYQNQTAQEISFKAKRPLGWGSTTSYTFDNGYKETSNVKNSAWMYTFLENVMGRKSCYHCQYASVNRVADISLGDFWGIEHYNPDFNDKKGTSIVLTTSSKGESLVEEVRGQCKLFEKVDVKNAVPYNSALSSHIKATPLRKKFFDCMEKMPFIPSVDRVVYKDKKDIGIVGWWYNLNYGGTLTYYSLNRALTEMGYSVLMIRRSTWNAAWPNEATVPMNFAKKHYSISRYYLNRDMHWLNYACKAFISGSDQLWNPYLEEYAGAEYFLSFVNEHTRKISYASSFGNTSDLPDDFVQKYSKYVNRFDAISVREDYAVDICKKGFHREPTLVCDPIFLAEKENFTALSTESKLNYPEEYLMCFLLDPDVDKVNLCRLVANNRKLENLVNFTDLQKVEEKAQEFDGEKVIKNGSIEDFVKAYMNASYIVTDSFHGTCMAIIFQKPFISIANRKRGEKRFVSLLSQFGLLDRLIYDVKDIKDKQYLLTESINYIEVNEKLQLMRQHGLNWLKDALKNI